VIAGVVLERHLKSLARQRNATLSEEDPFNIDKSKGMGKLTNWLIGKDVIPASEQKSLERLAWIRNCCDHSPGGNLRAPEREEVEQLIGETRRYARELRLP